MNIGIRDTSAPLFCASIAIWVLRIAFHYHLCRLVLLRKAFRSPFCGCSLCDFSALEFWAAAAHVFAFLPVSFALAPIKRRFLTTKILPHANFSPSSVGFIIFQRKWDFYGRIFRYLLLTVFMEVKRNLELCCLEIPSSSKSPDRRKNFSIPEQNIWPFAKWILRCGHFSLSANVCTVDLHFEFFCKRLHKTAASGIF